MKYIFFYDTAVGMIGIEEQENAITKLFFSNEEEKIAAMDKTNERKVEETDLLKETEKQLNDYFTGKRTSFQLPLSPEGTAFQKLVWNALMEIPYGETRSYGEIAKRIGNEKASRAVGMANNKNPIAIVIPCHRVIGADGKLVGYGGGIDKKVWLLNLEKIRKENGDSAAICMRKNENSNIR